VPTSSRILSRRRRDHERRRVPSRGRGGGRSSPCVRPSAAGDASLVGAGFEPPSTRSSLAKKKGRCGDAPPHHRSPVDRTRPARAPRPASHIPPLQKVERWEGQLTRTPLGDRFFGAAPEQVSTALARGGGRRFPHGTAAPHAERTGPARAPAPRLEDEEHLRVRDAAERRRGGACLLSDATVQPLGSVGVTGPSKKGGGGGDPSSNPKKN